MEYSFIFSSNYVLSFILGTLLVYCALRALKKSHKKYPPGPKGWPILGYLPFIGARPEEVLATLGNKHEHIFMFPVGIQNVVILNSLEAIKDSLVKQGETFSGKPPGFQLIDYGIDYLGVFSEEGESWKEQRKFSISTLREFGVGKLSIEEKILEECDALCAEISKFGDKPFCLTPLIANAITNTVSAIMFGERYEHDDPDFIALVELCKNVDMNISKITPLDYFPLLHKLPGWINGLDELHKIMRDFKKFSTSKIDKQMKTFFENSPRGYVDCFLQEMYKKNNNGEKNHVFDIPRLQSNILVFMVVGTVSTSMTLAWAILLLMSHPEVKQKLVQEIDSVLGRDQKSSWLDRTKMPYVEATILEVQRIGDVIPIGIAHSNTKATKVMGYDIPKRSMIFGNYRRIHTDPKLWGDPENFRPERFIDATTGECVKPEYLLTFGLGRRFCLGDVLARMNMFHMLTAVFQNFTVNPTRDLQKYPVKMTPGIIRYLAPFDVRAERRV